MTTMEWLKLTWMKGPVVERLAELIEVNGGLDVRGWGYISGGGIYGRHGLEQAEACELMTLGSIYRGMIIARPEDGPEAHAMIQKEINAAAERYREAHPDLAAAEGTAEGEGEAEFWKYVAGVANGHIREVK